MASSAMDVMLKSFQNFNPFGVNCPLTGCIVRHPKGVRTEKETKMLKSKKHQKKESKVAKEVLVGVKLFVCKKLCQPVITFNRVPTGVRTLRFQEDSHGDPAWNHHIVSTSRFHDSTCFLS